MLLLPEHKLFVGMLPKNVTDAEMMDLFSKYGNIKDLQILRGSQQTSKGKLSCRDCSDLNGALPTYSLLSSF